MAIARGRKIIVDGVEYRWRADGSRDRFRTKWTSPVLFLTIHDGKAAKQYNVESTLWTSEHELGFFDEYGQSSAKEHKVEFGPRMVAQIIRHDFTREERLALGAWAIRLHKKRNRHARTAEVNP